MGRFKRGDIIVNLWTERESPIHAGVYMGNGIVLYSYNGIHRREYDVRNLENDTEHFVKAGHCPVDELFKEMLELYTDDKEI